MSRTSDRPTVGGLAAVLLIALLAPAWGAEPLSDARIVVHKDKRELILFAGGTIIRKFRIGLGTNPVGPKRSAGDRRTPEGDYYVCLKNPKSAFYLSVGLSYPNEKDAERALKEGRISTQTYRAIARAINRRAAPPWKTALGGEIFIHGRGSGTDWTWGCIALDDEDMLTLYRAVKVGTPVTILP